MSSRPLWIVGALACSLAAVGIAGVTFFFWRDNFSTHYPLRALLADRLRNFELPLWNHWVGGGQPLAGNPNALAFYPDFPLALMFPPMVAFNLHFLLHWALGGWAMAFLLRAFGFERRIVTIGTLLWLFCGTVLSLFAFYNLIATVALIPLALGAAERLLRDPGWRPALLLGVAFGLLTLAGEPVTLLATALTALILAIGRISRRTVAWVLAAAVLALAIASPLVLAWSEIADEVERGARAYSTETVLAASLSPWQVAEIVFGPMRGLATDAGPRGYVQSGAREKWQPLLLSVFLSALAVPALFVARSPLRRVQIAAFVLLLIALGRHNPIVEALVQRAELLRLGRYPEKLAIPATLLLIVLIAGWLSRPRTSADRVASGAGIVLAALFAIGGMTHAFDVAAAMRVRIVAGSTLAAVVLLLAVFVSEKNKLAVLSIAALAPLVLTGVFVLPIDLAAPYRDASPLAPPLRSKRIVRMVAPEAAEGAFPHARQQYRAAATALDPVWGVPMGIGYTMDRSPEGMFSLLSRIVQERFAAGDDEVKARLARLVGASAIVHDGTMAAGSVRAVAAARVAHRTIRLYPLDDPLPPVLAAPNVESVSSIQDAVQRLESPQFDPMLTAIGPPGFEREGEIRVGAVHPISDGWRVATETASDAALLVNESYFRAWRAVDQEGRELGIFPMNLDRLGVAVPAGTTEVRVRFSRRRGMIAVAWGVSCAALLASLASLLFVRPRALA